LQSDQESIIAVMLSFASEHIDSLKAMASFEVDTFWDTGGSLRDWVTHPLSNLPTSDNEGDIEIVLSFILGTIPSFRAIFNLPHYPTSYILATTSRIIQSVSPLERTHASTTDSLDDTQNLMVRMSRSMVACDASARREETRGGVPSLGPSAKPDCFQQGASSKSENALDDGRHQEILDGEGEEFLGIPSKRPRLEEEQALVNHGDVALDASCARVLVHGSSQSRPPFRSAHNATNDENANQAISFDKVQETAFQPIAGKKAVGEAKDASGNLDLLDLEGCGIGFLDRAFDSSIMPNVEPIQSHDRTARTNNGDESITPSQAGNEDDLDFINPDELQNLFEAFKQDLPYEGETSGKSLRLVQRECNDTARRKSISTVASKSSVASKTRNFKHKLSSGRTKPSKRMQKRLPSTQTKAGKKKLPQSSARLACYKRIPSKFFNNPVILKGGMRLEAKGDKKNLNKLHCYVRKELLEVFVLDGSEDGQHRVGLRCVHCGCLPKSKRGASTMSAFYPKSVEDLYRAVCTWQRIHFKACQYIPDNVKEEYFYLKDVDPTRGKKPHWIKSAKAMGFHNIDGDRSGIVWHPGNNDVTQDIEDESDDDDLLDLAGALESQENMAEEERLRLEAAKKWKAEKERLQLRAEAKRKGAEAGGWGKQEEEKPKREEECQTKQEAQHPKPAKLKSSKRKPVGRATSKIVKQRNPAKHLKTAKHGVLENPGQFVGKRVAKEFFVRDPDDDKKMTEAIFFGTVEGISDDKMRWYLVEYDDGDGEEMNLKDLKHVLKLYEVNKDSDSVSAVKP
ncbi:MAG: hypothetical protein SGILL_009269, partial [Bacillariaceae sp.]